MFFLIVWILGVIDGMFGFGKWREFGVNVVNLGYCTNCEITKCPLSSLKCRYMWDWWSLRNDLVSDGFEDWGLRSESGKVCLGKREKSIHLAREKIHLGKLENIHLGRVSAVAEILQGRVRWSEKIKRWDEEEGRVWNGKEEWKASKVTERRKGGEGNSYYWEIVFFNTQGELCLKGETFFCEEIEQEKAKK